MNSEEQVRTDGAPLAEEAREQELTDGAPETEQLPSAEAVPAGSRTELEELRDRYLRLAAEYDNYRKRTDRERAEGRDRAQGQLIQSLLDPLDDLQRVADLDPETTTVQALLDGIQMVERKLLRALETHGLEQLDARGKPFNPEEHEALMTASTEDPSEDDTVGEVFQTGYRFRGWLVRPARVQVRKHAG